LRTVELFPDVQALNQIGVALRVLCLEIVEQSAPAADEHQEPTPRMVILCVGFEMLRQVTDALAQNGDLDFGRPGIRLVCFVVADQLRLAIFGERHLLWSSTDAPEPAALDRYQVRRISKKSLVAQDQHVTSELQRDAKAQARRKAAQYRRDRLPNRAGGR